MAKGLNLGIQGVDELADTRTSAESPRNEGDIRQKLVVAWQEFLGVPSIGLDENYFDLGGDSLTAVRLFTEIEKLFQIKLPLATLFEAPTIRELVTVVEKAATTSGWSTLVQVQTSGSRPPFFCVHGAGGNVLIYRDLSMHLGTDQPFYGLQAQGLDGKQPVLTKIEDMAARYIDDMRKVQPHGPYLLGGYCMGGTIAYEMAQQLTAAGERVALLALFDTINWCQIPLPGIWGKTYFSIERLFYHAANFARLRPAGWKKFFREKLKVTRNRIPVWRGLLLSEFATRSDVAGSEARLLGKIWKANDRACVKYVAQPYPGKVTDFRPIKQYRLYRKPDAKWDQLAQAGQKTVILPVYPAGMLVQPFVESLAQALRHSIDEALCAS